MRCINRTKTIDVLVKRNFIAFLVRTRILLKMKRNLRKQNQLDQQQLVNQELRQAKQLKMIMKLVGKTTEVTFAFLKALANRGEQASPQNEISDPTIGEFLLVISLQSPIL